MDQIAGLLTGSHGLYNWVVLFCKFGRPGQGPVWSPRGSAYGRAECHEARLLAAMSVNASLLPALNDLLLEVYAALRPKPVDYEQRNALVDVFSKMTTKIFGKRHSFSFLIMQSLARYAVRKVLSSVIKCCCLR
jgi:hypothetical protein